MMTLKSKWWVSCVVMAILGCATPEPKPALRATASYEDFEADPSAYSVGGYLPSDLTQKVYLTVSQGAIANISASPMTSAAYVLETNAIFMPGLIDMHSHIKYNVLPLWDEAKSQFKNRFEWREKSAEYKKAVGENMRAVKGDTVCAAVRWAELKALSGGVTAIQGIGGDAKCAKDFGIRNLEIPGDIVAGKRIRGMTDVIMPSLMGAVYNPRIQPYIKVKRMSYDQAYAEMLKQTGARAFVDEFVAKPHHVKNALILLVGSDLGVSETVSPADFDTQVAPKIIELLTTKDGPTEITIHPTTLAKRKGNPTWKKMKVDAAKKEVVAMKKWIYGAGGADRGYLGAPQTEAKGFEFLGKGGVKTVPSAVRRYVNMFENSVRQSVLSYLNDPNQKLAVLAHLAEGRSDDSYNKKEWTYLKGMGLAQNGVVLIHGVGLSRKEFAEVAKAKMSMVWSPFSNLLLYGQTLDVAGAKKAGVNLTLGADWTPTGGKTLLDELKIARDYIKEKRITGFKDKDIVDMATVNAAKALGQEGKFGCLEKGCVADFLLLNMNASPSKDPYTKLIDSTQKGIDLVVVRGEPLYGEVNLMAQVTVARGEGQPESVKGEGAACDYTKAHRLANLPENAYDRGLPDGIELRTKVGILKELTSKMTIAPDTLFSCEDVKYTNRIGVYVKKELPENTKPTAVASVREKQKLKPDYNPEGSPAEEGADGEDSHAAEQE